MQKVFLALLSLSFLFFTQTHAASPVVSFTQDVDAGPVSSDTIEISATDIDGDITATEYGFSADAICDVSDSFGTLFVSGVSFSISSEANNGDYLCVRVSEPSDGFTYLLSGNDLNIDVTPPAFDSLTVQAQTSGGGAKSVHGDGNFYLASGEKIYFTLNINPTDTIGSGSHINFSIGGTGTSSGNFTSSTTPVTTRNRTFTVGAENGTVALTSDTVTDQVGNMMTGFSTTLSDSIIVDTTAPGVVFTDDVDAGPTTSDDVTITVTETNVDSAEYGFVASAAACVTGATFGNSFMSGVPITFNTEGNNGNFVCVKVVDKAGNETVSVSGNDLNIDVTAPVFSSIGVVSDNAFDSSYGNATSTLTFTLTLSAADSFNGPGAGTGQITFDIGTTTGITADLTQAQSTTKKTTYTTTYALAGEDGAINITAIDFEDFQAQAMTGFVAGAPTPTVTIDTTAPTIDSASRASANANPAWAKSGDTVTYTLGFDEDVRLDTLGSATTGTNITTLTQEVDLPSFTTSDSLIFTVANGDNGAISVGSANFTIVDRAGNTTTVVQGDINALIAGVIQSDTTAPTITGSSIISNNVLDTTLAKTNDTITVDFITADNLSPTVTLRGNSHILNMSVTGSTIGAVGASSIERFTDGTETSEVVVPFRIGIQDEAGNNATNKTAVDDASQVQFDRTDPIVSDVEIEATSQDFTAFLGDLPTYYARMGDTINFEFELCDYVDSLANPPTGTFFGQAITMVDEGLTGSTCTTPEGNTANLREWSYEMLNADGVEGTVTFSIDIKDEAGNVFMSVTGTTDGSKVIFDKTNPTLPTEILDGKGAEHFQFKHRRNAFYDWSGESDPNTSAADRVSGIRNYDVQWDHPTFGTLENNTVNGPIYTPSLPIPSDDPYTFRVLDVRDKAGNLSGPEFIYTQLYTVGIYGTIFDEIGKPLKGATVQGIPTYNDTCLVGSFVCSTTTDENGNYELILRKQRDYIVSWYNFNHYLEKENVHVELDDVLRNKSLALITNPHQLQTGNEPIVISTDVMFQTTDGDDEASLIFVEADTGEVTVTPHADGFTVTSFGRIRSIRSNNPDVIFNFEGNNTYLVKGSGNLGFSHSAENSETQGGTPRAVTFGRTQNFASGSSRVGVEQGPANGKTNLRFPGMTREQFRILNRNGMTYTESMRHAQTMNKGVAGKVLFYENENGFEVFRGYMPGRLPLQKVGKRYVNTIKYRGGTIRNIVKINTPIEDITEPSAQTAFESRYWMIKNRYQNIPETETKQAKIIEIATKDTAEKQHATVMNARYQRIAGNKSYMYRPSQTSKRAPSRIVRNSADSVSVVIGGKKVAVGKMLLR